MQSYYRNLVTQISGAPLSPSRSLYNTSYRILELAKSICETAQTADPRVTDLFIRKMVVGGGDDDGDGEGGGEGEGEE